MSIIRLLACVLSAATIVAGACNTACFQSNLTLVNNDFQGYTAAINAYDGTSSKAVPVIQQGSKLDSDIKSAANQASGTTLTSPSDCTSLSNYFTNTLAGDIRTLCAAANAKASQFAAGGLQNVLNNNFANLKKDYDTLTTNFAATKCSNAAAKQAGNAAWATCKFGQTTTTTTTTTTTKSTPTPTPDGNCPSNYQTLSADIRKAQTTCAQPVPPNVNGVYCYQGFSAIQNDVRALNNSLAAGIALTSAQGSAILKCLTSSIEPNIKQLINVLKTQRTAYRSSGIQSLIINSFNQTRSVFASYGKTLNSKIPSANLAAANTVEKNIDNDFADGIAYYNS